MSKPRSKSTTATKAPAASIAAQPSAATVRAEYNGQSKVVLAQGAIQAAVAIVQTIQVLVEGHEYRSRLREMVKTLEADQSMRHADVDYLLEVLGRFKDDMSQQTRDEYFMSILKLLDVTGLRARLPLPPQVT